MSVTILIPTTLQALTGGRRQVSSDSPTVAAAIDELETQHPGFRSRILDDRGNLKGFISLYVNDSDVRWLGGLASELHDGDELAIIPAMAGG